MGTTKLIAEIGLAHDGSLGAAHAYIDGLSTTGVDAVKFQMHLAEYESSPSEPFRINFSYQDTSRYDYWERTSFTMEQWHALKKHCENVHLEMIISPFSIMALERILQLDLPTIKIPSGEVHNQLLLDRLISIDKAIILSSGMSTIQELDHTIQFLSPHISDLTLLQCTSSYPTKPNQWGLELISYFKERYQIKTGFSDHSGNIFASLAAVCHGASVLEFHVVFDKQMFGPDVSSSITIKQVADLVKGVREINESQKYLVNKATLGQELQQTKTLFEKSLVVKNPLPKGHTLAYEDLDARKPSGMGIPTNEFHLVIGKTLRHSISKHQFIKHEDLI